jgi:dihydrolipoamide dehydrogenase
VNSPDERHLGLLVDTDQGILLGAWAVAPMAGEWIHQAALAVRTRTAIEVLLDQVAQFPTYSEGFLAALEKLASTLPNAGDAGDSGTLTACR